MVKCRHHTRLASDARPDGECVICLMMAIPSAIVVVTVMPSTNPSPAFTSLACLDRIARNLSSLAMFGCHECLLPNERSQRHERYEWHGARLNLSLRDVCYRVLLRLHCH